MRIAAARLWNQPPLAESALPKKYGPKSRLAMSRSASRGPCRGAGARSGASALTVNVERPRLSAGRNGRLRKDDDCVLARPDLRLRTPFDLAREVRGALERRSCGGAVEPQQHPLDAVTGLRLGSELGRVANRVRGRRAQPRDDEPGQLDPPLPVLTPERERVCRGLCVALVGLETAGHRADRPRVVELPREEHLPLAEVRE